MKPEEAKLVIHTLKPFLVHSEFRDVYFFGRLSQEQFGVYSNLLDEKSLRMVEIIDNSEYHPNL